ncbi:MAG: deoxyribose-phosphate aldolase [Spirochaetes bacterium]|nr:deoxyribose-phosphate aldolase [Spirochaetota bacterium]
MELTKKEVIRMIEISAVQMPDGEEAINQLISYSKKYNFACVYALPCWIPYLKKNMKVNSHARMASAVGFPSGAHSKGIKLKETEELIAQGVSELDVVMNVGMLLSGRYHYVQDEIETIVDMAGDTIIKVIIEVKYLTEDTIKKACELCINANADYVKTSTGWTDCTTLEDISLIASFVKDDIKIKVAGGIRDLNSVIEMIKLGVSRFGINTKAAMKIIREWDKYPSGKINLV